METFRMLKSCRTTLVFAAGLAASGCATNPGSDEGLTDDLVVACTVSLESGDARPWLTVEAETFTFCVPPDMRATGRRSWRSSTGMIRWAYDEQNGSLLQARMPYSPVASTPLDFWESTEMIGGVEAELLLHGRGTSYKTAAEWKGVKVHMTGTARNLSEARRQIEIYRSVRFPNPPPDRTAGDQLVVPARDR
jgi:hypothetical protein